MKRIAAGLTALLVMVLVPSVADGATVPYPQIELSVPASVEPGGQIAVSGTLIRSDVVPYKKATVETAFYCVDPGGEVKTSLPSIETDMQGEFAFEITAGACNRYFLYAHFDDPDSSEYADGVAEVVVNRAPSTLVVDAPDTAFTGADYAVTVTLTGTGGVAIAGVSVQLSRSGDAGPMSWALTTDANGQASVTESTLVAGWLSYKAQYSGSVARRNAEGFSGGVKISRRSTAITLSAPDTAAIDQTFTVTGTLTGPPSPAEVTISGPGGFSTTTMTGDGGSFQVPVTLAAAGSFISARYAGSPLYDADQVVADITIPKLVTSIVLDPTEPVPTGLAATIAGEVTNVDEPVDVMIASHSTPSQIKSVSTDATGRFSTTVTTTSVVPFVGDEHWAITFAGSSRYAASEATATTTFSPLPTNLTVEPHNAVPLGSTFTLRGTVVGPQMGSKVTVQTSQGTFSGSTAAGGAFAFQVTALGAPGAGKYVVRYVPMQESEYAAATKTVYVTQREVPRIRLVPQRPRGAQPPWYYFYDFGDHPLFIATQKPIARGACHRYIAQKRVDGAWKTVRTSACRALDSSTGKSRWRWTGSHVRGVTYRVFVQVDARGRFWSAHSANRYIRFR